MLQDLLTRIPMGTEHHNKDERLQLSRSQLDKEGRASSFPPSLLSREPPASLSIYRFVLFTQQIARQCGAPVAYRRGHPPYPTGPPTLRRGKQDKLHQPLT